MAEQRIAIFLSFSGEGGVERMMVNLASALAQAGYPVDLVRAKVQGSHAVAPPPGIRVVDLGTRHTWSSLRPLIRYLRRERPVALLAAKDRANRVALRARRKAGVPTRIVVRLGTHLTQSLEGRSPFQRWLRYAPMRRAYPQADAIVVPSYGVAEDTGTITGIPPQRIWVIANPVLTPELFARAQEPLHHPWFRPRPSKPPVILAAGRLTRQKGFPTLLEAFARLCARRPARLLILGEGPDRPYLEAMSRRLAVEGLVDLPGFQTNPYAYMSRAALFVLSSRWEGLSNVLVEALALGVPVVATDCPSGPREILDHGRYGALVPVGDAGALAEAMAATLDRPNRDWTALQTVTHPYHAILSARRHLAALGFEEEEG